MISANYLNQKNGYLNVIYYFFTAMVLLVNLSVSTMQKDGARATESALSLARSQTVNINCWITGILEKKEQEYSANCQALVNIDETISTVLLAFSKRLKKFDKAVDESAKKRYEINDAYINNVLLTISNTLRDRSKIKNLSSSDAVYVDVDKWMIKLEEAMTKLKEAIKQEHK